MSPRAPKRFTEVMDRVLREESYSISNNVRAVDADLLRAEILGQQETKTVEYSRIYSS